VALADAARNFPIPLASFNRLIEGCRMDLVKTRYDTFDELLVYCDRVATTVSEMSLAIFGWKDPRTPEWGTHLSTALQLTNILRDVAEDARRGRIYLPQEDLERFRCPEADLSATTATPPFLRLMVYELEKAFQLFERAQPLCTAVSMDSRVAVALMGGVYLSIAQAVARHPQAVLSGRVQLGTFQKVGLVARALWQQTENRLGLGEPPTW
jgi:phytoene synthase